ALLAGQFATDQSRCCADSACHSSQLRSVLPLKLRSESDCGASSAVIFYCLRTGPQVQITESRTEARRVGLVSKPYASNFIGETSLRAFASVCEKNSSRCAVLGGAAGHVDPFTGSADLLFSFIC